MVTCRKVGGFAVWDYVVFGVMLLISAAIGVYYAFAGGGQRSREAFLMGGRSMAALPVALSLTASFMSAVTVLGTPAEIYSYGVMFSLFAIAYALMAVISAEIFLPVFYRLKITSTYEVGGPASLTGLRSYLLSGEALARFSLAADYCFIHILVIVHKQLLSYCFLHSTTRFLNSSTRRWRLEGVENALQLVLIELDSAAESSITL